MSTVARIAGWVWGVLLAAVGVIQFVTVGVMTADVNVRATVVAGTGFLVAAVGLVGTGHVLADGLVARDLRHAVSKMVWPALGVIGLVGAAAAFRYL